MKKYYLIIFCTILIGINCMAQNKGAITPDILKQVQNNFKKDAPAKALINAISNNQKINDLVFNRDIAGKTDHYFKYKVAVKGITNQKSSGRCWMFTGLNVMRPKIIDKLNVGEFEFSENYLYFWDMFEKANLFLEIINETASKPMDDKTVDWAFKNPIGDGGVWSSVANIVEKYGLVPKTIMPETAHSENTSMLTRILGIKLKEDGLVLRRLAEKKAKATEIQNKKIEMLSEIYRLLVYHLGEPPANFNWRFIDKDNKPSEEKNYTPQSFFKEMLNTNFDDYVMLMNDPSRPYYKVYEIEYDRNLYDGRNWKYLNLPTDEIKKYAMTSIKANEALYFSCDVGKQLNRDEGVLSLDNYDYESLYGIKFGMDKKDRIITFESGSSHGMALVGVDVDKNEQPTKWLLENSWGATAGHNGYLTMTDGWFNEYMFRMVVLKKFVDDKTLKLLEQKAEKLPPYDPMFKMDE